MMMLPPRSGRTALRMRDAAIIAELSDIYAHLMSAWVSEEVKPETNGEQGTFGSPEWIPEFRRRVIAVAQQIQQARVQTAMAIWEGSVRGRWPREEYNKLCSSTSDMVASLAQVGRLSLLLSVADNGTARRFVDGARSRHETCFLASY